MSLYTVDILASTKCYQWRLDMKGMHEHLDETMIDVIEDAQINQHLKKVTEFTSKGYGYGFR